jgi:outer membrane receptor for Fe3+-dicitrate
MYLSDVEEETKLSTNFTIMKICFRFLLICFCLGFLTKNAIAQPGMQLDTVVISANKLTQLKKEAPIAISVLNAKVIGKENATRVDFLLNKVSGVYMPSIGNEQHMMSIRQPISLKGLYLYLEDGMPIRTSGLFSNNALIEVNSSFIQQIEIIKGPASSLYGAEAIGGVVQFFTPIAPTKKIVEFASQANSLGFKKINANIALPNKGGGWQLNANWGAQNNGPIEYSNYSKKAMSLRHDFSMNEKWKGYQTLQYIDYYAQMTGSVDSIHFAQRNFSSLQTFTFRKINALRFRQNLEYQWNKFNRSTFNFMYRDNQMDQNPTYSIASTNNPIKFKGQTNRNEFASFVYDFQHILSMPKMYSKLILGGSLDKTQQHLKARYIDIIKDTNLGKYSSFNYPLKDSQLTNYQTNIKNAALYVNMISNFSKHLNMNLALRYDHFEYLFRNQINNGSPSSNNNFNALTPKVGFAYHQNKWGGYINYSKGFVPPQITEMYNAIKVPYLLPQSFSNMETGVWFTNKKWHAEISVYKLNGENEIISVRQTDGVNLNQNAGSTEHIGIEYQIKYKPANFLTLNWNATHAKHNYVTTSLKGVDVGGKEMNAAPRYWGVFSSELNFKKILIIADWQHMSQYFMDETNATTYPGFDALNLKLNFKHKNVTYWLHILNATNTYYATMATKNFSVKGNAAYSYYIGEPRSIAIGFNWSILGIQ